MNLQEYIIDHCERGACLCQQCIDAPKNPEEHQPESHTVDVIFFQVKSKNGADADELRRLIISHKGCFNDVDLFDGKEHNYLELGGWIGDQGTALMLMGLGSLLGLWKLLTPKTMLGSFINDEQARQMAGMGMISIQQGGDAL